MNTLIEYLFVGGIITMLALSRYFLMIGLYYWIVYGNRSLSSFKIQKRWPTSKSMKFEMYWGAVNTLNFGLVSVPTLWLYKNGFLKLYFDLSQYSIWFYIALIPFLLFLHDAYFFWLHFLMHQTKFGAWLRHDVHHAPDNVSPWAAFSVHPREGFFEILFRPIVLMVIPMHPLVFILFEILTFALNIIGHSGYEFFPANFASSPLTRLSSNATFHYLHHLRGDTNFSLFFNHWDRLMKTIHPDYETFYSSTKQNKNLVPNE